MIKMEIKWARQLSRWLSLISGHADYMRRAGSVCRDLGTSVKHTKNQLRDYMEKFQPD